MSKIYYVLYALPLLGRFSPDSNKNTCLKEGKRVWKIPIGKPESVSLLSLLETSSNWTAIENIGEVNFPIDWGETKTGVIEGKAYVRFPLEIPTYPPVNTIGDEKYSLEICHYGHLPATYELYDDRATYNHLNGEFTSVEISVVADGAGNKKGNFKVPDKKDLWSMMRLYIQIYDRLI